MKKSISILLTLAIVLQITGLTFNTKEVEATTNTWTFTTPSNYTYTSDDIEVTGGIAQLKATSSPNWYDSNYGYCRKMTMTAGGESGGVATTTTSGFALVATSTIYPVE